MVGMHARRLEQEVDAIVSAAVKAGVGSTLSLELRGQDPNQFTIDRIVTDDLGRPTEIWLSRPQAPNFWDRFKRVQKRHLLRVSRHAGDVRRVATTVSICPRKRMTHLHFHEEVGAPRLSRAVATFRYPRPDAAEWLHDHSGVIEAAGR